MKTNFPEQFFNKGQGELKKLVMTAEEKQTLHDRLSSEIPGLAPLSVKSPYAPARGWLVFSGWTIVSRRLAYVALSCAVIIFTSTSLAFAAEGSLPGDPLYPLKIKVTEPIRTALTVTPQAQVQWEAQKAERRLQEAEALAAKGGLNVEKRQALEADFETHLQAFDQLSQKLDKDSEQKAQDTLEVVMKAHSRVLGRIANHADQDQKKEVEDFSQEITKKADKQKVDKQTSAAKKDKKASEHLPTNIEQLQGLQGAVDKNIKKTESQSFDSLDKDQSSDDPVVHDIIDDAKGVLKEAQKSLDNSRKHESSGDLNAAYDSLIQSERSVEEANITLKQGLKLGKQKKNQN